MVYEVLITCIYFKIKINQNFILLTILSYKKKEDFNLYL